jgi:hypothetical protein
VLNFGQSLSPVVAGFFAKLSSYLSKSNTSIAQAKDKKRKRRGKNTHTYIETLIYKYISIDIDM